MATDYEPITIACDHCSHEWETRAAIGSAPHCPNCKKTRRIRISDRTISNDPDWAESEQTVDDSKPSNIACGECESLLYPTVGGTSLICKTCDNIQPTPTAVNRGIVATAKERREVVESSAVVDTGPVSRTQEELMQRTEFAANRAKVIAAIYELAEHFNPNGLPDDIRDAAQSHYIDLHAMADTCKGVADHIELSHISSAYGLKRNQLHWAATRTDQAREDASVGPTVIQGRITPRAIASANSNDGDDDEYDDEEYDDEEYDDRPRITGFEPNAAFPWKAALILCGIVVAFYYGNQKYSEWLDSIIPVNCEFHKLGKAPASRSYTAAYDGSNTPMSNAPMLYACDKHSNAAITSLESQGWHNPVYGEGPFNETRRNRKERRQSTNIAA